MNPLALVVGVSFLVSSACTAYRMAPLSTDHPANPWAASSPERLLSKTLAYRPEDMPARPVTAAQQGGHEGHHQAPSLDASKTVVGEGKVVATVPSSGQLVVEHGEIKGFMEAMTMGYLIEPPSLLEGLKMGDRVRFTIDVEKKAIVKIEKLS